MILHFVNDLTCVTNRVIIIIIIIISPGDFQPYCLLVAVAVGLARTGSPCRCCTAVARHISLVSLCVKHPICRMAISQVCSVLPACVSQ